MNIYKNVFNEKLYNHIKLNSEDIIKKIIGQIRESFSVHKTGIIFSYDAQGYPHNSIEFTKIGMQPLKTFSEAYTLAVVLKDEWKKTEIGKEYHCYIKIASASYESITRWNGDLFGEGIDVIITKNILKTENTVNELDLRKW